MATSLALSLAVVLSFGGSAAADDAKEEALPATPPAPPSVPSYGTTVKADGTPVAVVVSGGAGGKLSIVNLNTGESTAKDFDDGGADAQPWGFATLKDKTVLIGAGKGLYRYNPADDSVEVLSKAGVPGYEQVAGRADFIWDIAVDENDTAYIATQVSPEHGEGGNVLTWRPGSSMSAASPMRTASCTPPSEPEIRRSTRSTRRPGRRRSCRCRRRPSRTPPSCTGLR